MVHGHLFRDSRQNTKESLLCYWSWPGIPTSFTFLPPSRNICLCLLFIWIFSWLMCFLDRLILATRNHSLTVEIARYNCKFDFIRVSLSQFSPLEKFSGSWLLVYIQSPKFIFSVNRHLFFLNPLFNCPFSSRIILVLFHSK